MIRADRLQARARADAVINGEIRLLVLAIYPRLGARSNVGDCDIWTGLPGQLRDHQIYVRSLLNTRLSERPEIAYSLYELETAINFLSPKLAISGRDTLSLDPSIKTYTDAILQIKLICRYICCHAILLYVYVYELCIKELNDETMIGASFVIYNLALVTEMYQLQLGGQYSGGVWTGIICR